MPARVALAAQVVDGAARARGSPASPGRTLFGTVPFFRLLHANRQQLVAIVLTKRRAAGGVAPCREPPLDSPRRAPAGAIPSKQRRAAQPPRAW